jgi:hypothetical protein
MCAEPGYDSNLYDMARIAIDPYYQSVETTSLSKWSTFGGSLGGAWTLVLSASNATLACWMIVLGFRRCVENRKTKTNNINRSEDTESQNDRTSTNISEPKYEDNPI